MIRCVSEQASLRSCVGQASRLSPIFSTVFPPKRWIRLRQARRLSHVEST